MKRTQIQLPDPLFKEVKRVASLMDISIAEVVRRGIESFIRKYPTFKLPQEHWTPPSKGGLGEFLTDHVDWRSLTSQDQEKIP